MKNTPMDFSFDYSFSFCALREESKNTGTLFLKMVQEKKTSQSQRMAVKIKELGCWYATWVSLWLAQNLINLIRL